MSLDKRALQILTSTFWTPAGWRRDPQTSAEDFAYAKAHGLMFDPVRQTHDEAVSSAISACRRLSKQRVVAGFIVSLRARRLDLRSALGSYAVGRHLTQHSHEPHDSTACCPVCGDYRAPDVDPNLLSFERIKWGGVRHDKPSYIAFDLARFEHLPAVEADAEDHRALKAVIDTARRCEGKTRLADLEKALGPVLASNSAERRALIGILGYCGLLVDGSKPDFRDQFVPWSDREHTRWSKDDWPYPVKWWTGASGVSEAAVDEWFPSASL